MKRPIRVALIGYGKIARDQHGPAIAADPSFELTAVTSRGADPGVGVPAFADLESLMASGLAIDAVAICTPPQARHAIARQALAAGLNVLLEKPPAATLGEIADLVSCAGDAGRTLYTGWHSQHAPAVAHAAGLLQGASVRRLDIRWFEDVRKWHPGQDWVWEAGGFGVFDPGINALSIATAILPGRLLVSSAALDIPAGRQAPIAATLIFSGSDHQARFDWNTTDGDTWTIAIETGDGRHIEIRDGGARLFANGAEQAVGPHREYASIYERFAARVAEGRSEVDAEPLRVVADAFLVGRRTPVAPFRWISED